MKYTYTIDMEEADLEKLLHLAGVDLAVRNCSTATVTDCISDAICRLYSYVQTVESDDSPKHSLYQVARVHSFNGDGNGLAALNSRLNDGWTITGVIPMGGNSGPCDYLLEKGASNEKV